MNKSPPRPGRYQLERPFPEDEIKTPTVYRDPFPADEAATPALAHASHEMARLQRLYLASKPEGRRRIMRVALHEAQHAEGRDRG